MNKTGFGFLRLPSMDAQDENKTDFTAACALADHFMALGGNYFDTAYTYLQGNSEAAIREAVVKRYPRNRFRIADKLPPWKLECADDCRRIFDEQLVRCGVDFFDVYLLHGLDAENYEICERLGAFDFVSRLKAQGRVRSIGFSYHDSPELLEKILTEHPEMEYVQLQINYLDWESPVLQARALYETAARHKKKIIVMEPVKGGSLARLPDAAVEILRGVHPEWSPAEWAIRFVTGLEDVEIVLSGMNAGEQIDENMRSMEILSDKELAALARAAEVIRSATAVGCTGCSYCTVGCPKGIAIPKYFSLYNEYARSPREKWKMEYLYDEIRRSFGAPEDCIACGACEGSCPQKIGVIETLKKVHEVFAVKEED